MSKPGHNSKTQPTTVAGQKIKSYVDRVEKLEEERKAIGGDIRDVYAEAKGNGYDVKTLRWLVQERRVQAVDRDERDALRDTYKHALDMAVHLVQVEGLSLREAAKRTGTNKSSVHRALAVPHVSQETQPEDCDDGIAESREEGVDLLAVAAEQPSIPSVPAEQSVTPCLPLGGESPVTTEGKARDSANTSPGGPEVARVAPPASDDDLAIPPFLRGSRQGRGA